MVQSVATHRIREEILRLCETGLDWLELSEAVARYVRKVVPYDAACWHTMDPATLLLTGNATEHLPSGGLPVLAACEYGSEDVNKWGFLSKQQKPVGRLSTATQGQPELSNRYRVLLQPIGLSSELRVSFRDGSGCWGAAGFYRAPEEPDFTQEQEDFIRMIAGPVSQGYRRALTLGLLEAEQPSDGPGLVVLGPNNEIESISAAAERWLGQLPRESRSDLPLPLLSLTERVRSPRAFAELKDGADLLRVRTPEGVWLLIRAVPLDGRSAGQLGVTIEPAGPSELAQLLIGGYGLSQREQEVAYAVLRGDSTKEIAEELFISPHTVQDHLKAIFRKLSVNSRREMVSRVYSEHYLPKVNDGRAPLVTGWFGPGVKPTTVSTGAA